MNKIPPGWKNVKISRDPNSYIQAVGYDVKGRKQYIYHPLFTEYKTIEKFKRLKEFCRNIDKLNSKILTIRRNINDKEYVISMILRIMSKTYIRIGSENYDTYGICTLEKRHVTLMPENKINFNFIGKKSIKHSITIRDNLLYRDFSELLKARKKYDKIFDRVSSIDVNNYIKQEMGPLFTSKDFRTYACNRLVVELLKKCENHDKPHKNISMVVKSVAEKLGHTPHVSKKSYIMYKIIEKYLKDPIKFINTKSINIIIDS